MSRTDIEKRGLNNRVYQRYCPSVERNVFVEDVIDVPSGESCVLCHNKYSCEQTGGCHNELFNVWNV